jgi:transcription elongation factor Elf1
MISKDLLRSIRNDLPMKLTIVRLGRHGPITKPSDGYFRFPCPACGELRATVNPRNNLAHCFCCGQNFNNIDLLMNHGLYNASSSFHSTIRHDQQRLTAIDSQRAADETDDRAAWPTRSDHEAERWLLPLSMSRLRRIARHLESSQQSGALFLLWPKL